MQLLSAEYKSKKEDKGAGAPPRSECIDQVPAMQKPLDISDVKQSESNSGPDLELSLSKEEGRLAKTPHEADAFECDLEKLDKVDASLALTGNLEGLPFPGNLEEVHLDQLLAVPGPTFEPPLPPLPENEVPQTKEVLRDITAEEMLAIRGDSLLSISQDSKDPSTDAIPIKRAAAHTSPHDEHCQANAGQDRKQRLPSACVPECSSDDDPQVRGLAVPRSFPVAPPYDVKGDEDAESWMKLKDINDLDEVPDIKKAKNGKEEAKDKKPAEPSKKAGEERKKKMRKLDIIQENNSEFSNSNSLISGRSSRQSQRYRPAIDSARNLVRTPTPSMQTRAQEKARKQKARQHYSFCSEPDQTSEPVSQLPPQKTPGKAQLLAAQKREKLANTDDKAEKKDTNSNRKMRGAKFVELNKESNRRGVKVPKRKKDPNERQVSRSRIEDQAKLLDEAQDEIDNESKLFNIHVEDAKDDHRKPRQDRGQSIDEETAKACGTAEEVKKAMLETPGRQKEDKSLSNYPNTSGMSVNALKTIQTLTHDSQATGEYSTNYSAEPSRLLKQCKRVIALRRTQLKLKPRLQQHKPSPRAKPLSARLNPGFFPGLGEDSRGSEVLTLSTAGILFGAARSSDYVHLPSRAALSHSFYNSKAGAGLGQGLKKPTPRAESSQRTNKLSEDSIGSSDTIRVKKFVLPVSQTPSTHGQLQSKLRLMVKDAGKGFNLLQFLKGNRNTSTLHLFSAISALRFVLCGFNQCPVITQKEHNGKAHVI